MGLKLHFIAPLLAAGAAAIVIAAGPSAFAAAHQSCNGSGAGTICLSPSKDPMRTPPPGAQQNPSGDVARPTLQDFALALGLTTWTWVSLVDLIKNGVGVLVRERIPMLKVVSGDVDTDSARWPKITRSPCRAVTLNRNPFDTLRFHV